MTQLEKFVLKVVDQICEPYLTVDCKTPRNSVDTRDLSNTLKDRFPDRDGLEHFPLDSMFNIDIWKNIMRTTLTKRYKEKVENQLAVVV